MRNQKRSETQWLRGRDPAKMLCLLEKEARARKFRLFALACCHRLQNWITDEWSRAAINIAEQFVEGQASAQDLSEIRQAYPAMDLQTVIDWDGLQPSFCKQVICLQLPLAATYANPYGAAKSAARCDVAHITGDKTRRKTERRIQANILRDIFGNPFRPVACDPAWRTADVTAIAATIYTERRFADLPILADALEEAGCTSAELLAHCRQPGEHVRGCWAVDLVLGKS